MVYNENQLMELLGILKNDPMKVVSCQYFFNDQWIQYNREKCYYEYEDGSFLGNSPDNVIEFYNSMDKEFAKWLETAKWFIKEN